MTSRTPKVPADGKQEERASAAQQGRSIEEEEEMTSRREGTRPEVVRERERDHPAVERPTTVHWAPRPLDLLADVTRRLRQTARALERSENADQSRGRAEQPGRSGPQQQQPTVHCADRKRTETGGDDVGPRDVRVMAPSAAVSSAGGAAAVGGGGDTKPAVRLHSPGSATTPPPRLGLPLSSPPSQPSSLGDLRPSPAVPPSPLSPDSNPLRAWARGGDLAGAPTTETLLVPGRYDLHLDMLTLEEEAQYMQEAGPSSRRPSTASLSRYRSCPQLRDASPTEGAASSSPEGASGPESEGVPAPATPDSRASDLDRDLDYDLDPAAPTWLSQDQGAWGRTWSRDSGSLDVRPPAHEELRARWDAMTLTSMTRCSPPPLAQPEDSRLDLDTDYEVSSDSRVRPRGLRGSDPRDKCRQWLQSLKLSRLDRLKSRSQMALPPW